MHVLRSYLSSFRPMLFVVYIAGMGVGCVYAAMLYMGLRPDIQTGLVFMGLVYGIYIINRFTDMKEDFANDLERPVLFAKARVFFQLGVAALIFSSIYLILSKRFTQFHILIIVLGILYSYHLIPWYSRTEGLKFFRLKEIPFVKNLIVAILWGTSVFLVPILYCDHRFNDSTPVIILVCTLCIAVLNNTVFGDIKDAAGDRLARNRTLPTAFGLPGTYAFLVVINAAWAVFFVSLFLLGRMDVHHLVFISAISLYPAVYMLPYHAGLLSKPKVEFISDSILVVFALGLVLLSFCR